MRLQEYIQQLLNKRSKEAIKKDFIYGEGESFSSPTGSIPAEEIRLFNEYKEQANLFRITDADPKRKKAFVLKRFLKMKKNQQVEVYSQVGEEEVLHTVGKVSVVGRDFVMLTNLKDRIWLPYQFINSANIPSGIPNYSNSHQYYMFDNNLRQKLLTNFGQTVSKREELIQQFYEESLETNLLTWKSTWVKVVTPTEVLYGKMVKTDQNQWMVQSLREKKEVLIKDIVYIQSLRMLSLLPIFKKNSHK